MGDLLNGGESLAWFIVLFLPGFLSAEVYGMMVASERSDFSKDFFRAVAFSVLNFAILAPIIYALNMAGLFSSVLVVWVTVYVALGAAPIGWAFLVKWLRDASWTPFLSSNNKAWDDFFSRCEPVWVVAHLHDGTKVGGFYAGDSYASSFPSEEQIYVQQQWLLGENDEFLRAVKQSAGLLLNARDVKVFEFYEYEG